MNDEHDDSPAMLNSERLDLIDSIVSNLRFRLELTEADARKTAVEIIDIGTQLFTQFTGTDEFDRAKAIVDARVRTKLASIQVRASNQAKDLAREFAMGAILGARAFLIGKVAP
ncbi:MAG: hypothetical protein NXI14_09055 [bacterium]|nr:hypothetical protein [bacterium]